MDSQPTLKSTIFRSRQWISRVAIAGALLATGGTGFALWRNAAYQKSPEYTVRRFIEADLNNQPSAQDPLVLDRWDSKCALQAFQAVRRQSGSSPFCKYTLLGHTETQESARVTVGLEVAFPGVPGVNTPLTAPERPKPAFVPITFVLNREQDAWKIDGTLTLTSAAGSLGAAGYSQIAPILRGEVNVCPPEPKNVDL